MTNSKAVVEVILHSPQTQLRFNQTIGRIKTEFHGTHIKVIVKTRKLIPLDIIVELVVQVGALLLYDVVKKLTSDLAKQKIPMRLDFETRENLAQSYLLRNRITQFKLKTKTDHEDVSSYTFVDKKKSKYSIRVGADGSVRFRTASKQR